MYGSLAPEKVDLVLRVFGGGDEDAYYIGKLFVRKARVLFAQPSGVEDSLRS
jgi:hypothetical protein